MDRKSPYTHPVKEHVRAGVRVKKYTRGSGKKPRKNTGHRHTSGKWSIAFTLSDGSTETYIHSGGDTAALKAGLMSIQSPSFPKKAVMRRLEL